MNDATRLAGQRIGLKLLTSPPPDVEPQEVMQADPAALASMRARIAARRRPVLLDVEPATPTPQQLEYSARLRDAALAVVRGADAGEGDYCVVPLLAVLALAEVANVRPPLALVDQRRGFVASWEITPDAIQRFRRRQGWSQRELAGRMGVTHQAVHYWETGRSNLSARYLARLQRLMNSTEACLSDEDTRKRAATNGIRQRAQ